MQLSDVDMDMGVGYILNVFAGRIKSNPDLHKNPVGVVNQELKQLIKDIETPIPEPISLSSINKSNEKKVSR